MDKRPPLALRIDGAGEAFFQSSPKGIPKLFILHYSFFIFHRAPAAAKSNHPRRGYHNFSFFIFHSSTERRRGSAGGDKPLPYGADGRRCGSAGRARVLPPAGGLRPRAAGGRRSEGAISAAVEKTEEQRSPNGFSGTARRTGGVCRSHARQMPDEGERWTSAFP